jgi:hypothetical protein
MMPGATGGGPTPSDSGPVPPWRPDSSSKTTPQQPEK